MILHLLSIVLTSLCQRIISTVFHDSGTNPAETSYTIRATIKTTVLSLHDCGDNSRDEVYGLRGYRPPVAQRQPANIITLPSDDSRASSLRTYSPCRTIDRKADYLLLHPHRNSAIERAQYLRQPFHRRGIDPTTRDK